MLKRLNTTTLITIGLSIGIIVMIILIVRKLASYRQKIGNSTSSTAIVPSSSSEYFGTASELAGLSMYRGSTGFSDYRPDEGIFARDPIDINVRSDITGGSAYETSGSSIFLDPSQFSVYHTGSDEYGLY